MNYKISFQELSKLSTEQLSKQLPTTLAEAKKQVLWLQTISTTKTKKKRD